MVLKQVEGGGGGVEVFTPHSPLSNFPTSSDIIPATECQRTVSQKPIIGKSQPAVQMIPNTLR